MKMSVVQHFLSSSSSSSCISSLPGGDISDDGNAVEISSNLSKFTPGKSRQVKKFHFFRNGDVYFKGITLAFPPERYRTYESVVAEVTRALSTLVNLPNGVRNLFNLQGKKVFSLEELEDGKSYVAAGLGEAFKKLDYVGVRKGPKKPIKNKLLHPEEARKSKPSYPSFIFPHVITVVKCGVKPRKVVRLLINKKNAPTFDNAMTSITNAVKLDTGPVMKVYNAEGNQVTCLDDFFMESQDVFFAYGLERPCRDDFDLDPEELKAIRSIKKFSQQWSMGNPSKVNLRSRREDGLQRLKMPLKTKQSKPNETILLQDNLTYPQVILIKYEMGPVIGDGNFAVVRKCKERKTGEIFALKIIDKAKCVGKEDIIDNEVSILRSLYHCNIVRLVAEYFSETHLYLTMEYIKGGDLFDAIQAETKFCEAEASSLLKDLASAIFYLHTLNIVHRDIKPENILVSIDNRGKKSLKLGDFGLAQKVTGPLFTVCGTPTYVAPEVLAEVGYGLKIDVWAAGVILYILLCGYPPFVSMSDDQDELFDRILGGNFVFNSPYWDSISQQAKDLITHMLLVNPEIRFSAEDVLDHSWFMCNDLGNIIEDLHLEDGGAGAVSR